MNRQLAPDIIKKIKADFAEEYVAEVTAFLQKAASETGIVGSDQLARSLLFLSKKDIDILRTDCVHMVKKWDPRDIVMTAEEQSGNNDHWFGLTFDEIETYVPEYNKGLHAYWDALLEEEELKKYVSLESGFYTKLAYDIIKKIKADFAEEYVAEVIAILEKKIFNSIVGSDQLARSLVYLSKGDINTLKNEVKSMDDPRDMILYAEEQAGHPEHFFGVTFDEMGKYVTDGFTTYERELRKYWADLAKEEEAFKEDDWERYYFGNEFEKGVDAYWNYLWEEEELKKEIDWERY